MYVHMYLSIHTTENTNPFLSFWCVCVCASHFAKILQRLMMMMMVMNLVLLLSLLLLPDLFCFGAAVAAGDEHHRHGVEDQEAMLLSGRGSFLSHEMLVSPLRETIEVDDEDDDEAAEAEAEENSIEWNSIIPGSSSSHTDSNSDGDVEEGRHILSMRIMHRDSPFSPLNKKKSQKQKQNQKENQKQNQEENQKENQKEKKKQKKQKQKKMSEVEVFAERLRRDEERVKQIYARMERKGTTMGDHEKKTRRRRKKKEAREEEVVIGTSSYHAEKQMEGKDGEEDVVIGTPSYHAEKQMEGKDGEEDVVIGTPSYHAEKQMEGRDGEEDVVIGTPSYHAEKQMEGRDGEEDVVIGTPTYHAEKQMEGRDGEAMAKKSKSKIRSRSRSPYADSKEEEEGGMRTGPYGGHREGRGPARNSSYSEKKVAGFITGPLISGLNQGSGEYFTRIGVGTPAKQLFMVIDTGSDIMWLQCAPCEECYAQTDPIFDPSASRSFRYLPCTSPVCNLLELHECQASTNLCLYQVVYGDGSFTEGDFATEALTFKSMTVQNVALGCGNDNEGLFEGAAGLFGLGGGSLSFVSQLTTAPGTGPGPGPRQYPKIFSYCLLDRDRLGLSTVTFGGFPAAIRGARTSFAPLLINHDYPTFYYAPVTGISVGGVLLASIPASAFHMDTTPGPTNGGGVIIDSGTSVSRLNDGAYMPLRAAFRAAAASRALPFSGSFSLFDTCYDLSGRRAASVPTVTFHFQGGATMDLPTANYFVPIDSRGTYCLAFSSTSGLLSIIGNIQQQGFRMVFDAQSYRLGIAPNQC